MSSFGRKDPSLDPCDRTGPPEVDEVASDPRDLEPPAGPDVRREIHTLVGDGTLTEVAHRRAQAR